MTLLAERYDVTEPLGTGGMAEVYAAYDNVLQRRVAIKIIHQAHLEDPVNRERFAQEARIAAALQHPNTVAVFDVGEDGGRPFIVMELVEGRSLADRIRQEGRLPVEDVVPMMAAVLAGLQAAHERGLVHRDVKPSNILLPASGGVKLADFGIATVVADASKHLTSGDQVLGTPRYLAPERVAGHAATPASDVYSLGAVMYESLSGRAPFTADTPVALAVAHRHEPVRPLTSLVPDVPPAIAAAVQRALAKDPAARFSSAAEMRAALLGAPPDGSPNQHPTMPVDITQRLPVLSDPRRRRWLPVLGGLLAAVVLAVAAVYLLALDDSEGGTVEPGAGQEPGGAQDEDADAAPEDEPEDAGDEAADLSGLIDAVAAADRGTGGEKVDSLLDDLRELAANPDDGEARKLIEEVGVWTAEGELDADLGRTTIEVLEQESRPEEPDLTSVSELLADVAIEMPAWGDKAKDLMSNLRELLDTEPPGQRIQQARELTGEIDKWIGEGELDASRGARALDVLQPLG